MPTKLTSGQRSLLMTELEQHRVQLSQQLAEHLHGQSLVERAADVAAQDADDAPQRGPEREVSMALTDREMRELEAVTAALKRITGEHFGVCADCAEDIPFDRLKAEPWTTRCVTCEAADEGRRR